MTSAARTLADIAYGTESERQKLDLYFPQSGEGPYPLVINIHGGAFMMGSKGANENDCASMDEVLKAGYAFASIGYRLSGEAIFPAAAQDCKSALYWLKTHAAEYNFDPSKFVLWGRSAGGHLAALVGLSGNTPSILDDQASQDPSVDMSVAAVVDWYGPTDFSKMDEQFREHTPALCTNGVQNHDDPESPESKLLGGPVQEMLELNTLANPLHYVSTGSDIPPFFLGVGDSDCLVPHQQTLILHEALQAKGVPTQLHVLQNIGHAGPVFEEQLTPKVLVWLENFFNSPQLSKS